MNLPGRISHLASASAKIGSETIWAALCGDRAIMRDGVWQRLLFVNDAPSCKRCAKVDRAMRGGRLRVTLKAMPAPAEATP